MKKISSVLVVLVVCMAGLCSCIQITTPAPQQQNNQFSETMTQQQTTAPIQQTQPVQPAQQAQQTQPIQPVQSVQQTQPIQQGYTMPQFSITIEQAKQNALSAVGMSASNVTFTKQKQDYDDGMPEYEIEFVANNMKYEFEVSGANGAILKQEVESIYND